MFKVFSLIAILIVAGSACSNSLAGANYQQGFAADKLTNIWSQITSNTETYGWYSTVRMPELFIESASTSFTSVGDDMPCQGLFNTEERPKLIHSVGSIATGKFVSNGQHPYTGIFRGVDNILIRLSSAKQATQSPPNVTPGLTLKFFRDGVQSANIFAMVSLEGQSSFNLFEHDLTNHVPNLGPNAPLALTALKAKFLTASQWPTMIGVNDCASYDQNGNQESSVNFPFRLIFHPSTQAHTSFNSAPHGDDKYYLNDLQGQQFQVLYEIYAQDTPTATSYIPLGEIQMTSAFTSTQFGDKDLFFQHSFMEDDFAVHPEWVADAQNIMTTQGAVDYYTFPDMPWN